MVVIHSLLSSCCYRTVFYALVVCTDPSVESYRIQWGPEHCSHNHTRPMEKTSTQVTYYNNTVIGK